MTGSSGFIVANSKLIAEDDWGCGFPVDLKKLGLGGIGPHHKSREGLGVGDLLGQCRVEPEVFRVGARANRSSDSSGQK